MNHDSHYSEIDIQSGVVAARKRIRDYIRETPLVFSPILSKMTRNQVFLKLENWQITRSFKLRGAANKLLSLDTDERARGIVTASSGNHGAAVAYMMKKLGCEGIIFLPENVSKTKTEHLRQYGANVRFYGNDCVMAEMKAREEAVQSKSVFISPYNDEKIICGQGTIGIELACQIPHMEAVLIPVGGGGLISGVGGYLKSIMPSIRIIGCQPENSAVMYHSLQSDQILDIQSFPTLSEGTAGGIEKGAVTFELCRKHVDDFILVSEEDIRNALMLMIGDHHMMIEGAAVLPVAALLKVFKTQHRDQHIVLVISGANLDIDLLKTILQ